MNLVSSWCCNDYRCGNSIFYRLCDVALVKRLILYRGDCMSKQLQELLENKKQDTVEKFADYLLKKMKREYNFSVRIENGYIMAGYGVFIVNDNKITIVEARKFIIDECNKLIKC